MNAAQTEIGYKKKEMTRKPWITKDMIMKMKERKEWKSKNAEEGKQRYRQLNNELRREVDKAKKSGGVENVTSWKNLTQKEGLTWCMLNLQS